MKNAAEFKAAGKLKEDLLKAIEKKMEIDGISQGEVARRIGALRNNVNQIMRRKANTTLDFLVKIAESIGLDVELMIKKAKE